MARKWSRSPATPEKKTAQAVEESCETGEISPFLKTLTGKINRRSRSKHFRCSAQRNGTQRGATA
jgi:hypothetical protein